MDGGREKDGGRRDGGSEEEGRGREGEKREEGREIENTRDAHKSFHSCSRLVSPICSLHCTHLPLESPRTLHKGPVLSRNFEYQKLPPFSR